MPLTRISSQCQLRWGSVERAAVQVDAKQRGDEEGSHGQLQEVAVDVGEVDTLVHRCCYCEGTHDNGKETWTERKRFKHSEPGRQTSTPITS